MAAMNQPDYGYKSCGPAGFSSEDKTLSVAAGVLDGLKSGDVLGQLGHDRA